MSLDTAFDLDWLAIGSGFGGSVSALRLAEKGYRVAVLEQGRRFADGELPKSAWQLRRFLWAPKLGLQGILRITRLRDVNILSGAGVGGGSLVYAATLYRAPRDYFQHPQWRDLADWESLLGPHYDTAERMLGVTEVPFDSPAEHWLKQIGTELGCADTYRRTRVGIFFGEAGRTIADPFFAGEGPQRTGCTRCGSCMLGCPVGAKNTLVRNYLHLAERRGVAVHALRRVVDVRPLGAADGSDGYLVTHERSGAWGWRRDRQTLRVRGVVFAAGALGTNELLARCKLAGSLPQLSDRLGELVRTNSETMLAVTMPGDAALDRSVSITGSLFPDAQTHIEAVTLGPAMDAFAFNYGPLVGAGTRLTRPLQGLVRTLRRPLASIGHLLWPWRWSRRTLLVGLMQTSDNAIRFVARRRWLGGGVRLDSSQDADRPLPSFYPLANRMAEWLARRSGGVARSTLADTLFNVPTTAHILGGAVIGRDAASGVVDARQRVFGYRNLLVCDGSVVPANPGVNPSLTIAAMTELAISHLPTKDTTP
ncbi:GMC family oxidoreductase [Pelomonas sp. SE-A7]|uniref:GMC oxidoreductase n=1 Tax=Pelomonas sp. SE-A7 TaxID=3054953 RepID=UPI00259CAD6E|nr:GMC family oxidoreductase [Pelomonas sp. SE-A7]MDM4764777.1 GMC family oxidoreductase [Pelomonas sp. SE-A7]